MNTQFKKGVLELCVLAVVNRSDMYGYDLVQKISHNIAITEGTIYPLLRRLSIDGLFTTYLQESNDGPSRKYYKITEKGKIQLNNLKQNWNEFMINVNLILNENN